MNPEETARFNAMEQKVNELYEFMQDKKRNQLSLPLDIASMQAIAEGLKSIIVERLNVRDIFFQATQESPTEEGQMRFFNDRATQTFRVTTTKGVFTGTIDLTAV